LSLLFINFTLPIIPFSEGKGKRCCDFFPKKEIFARISGKLYNKAKSRCIQLKELSETILTQLIQPRPAKSHKGTFGRVLLIGGNQQFGGAIIMSALAAVASGAGLTTVVTAPQNLSALHNHCLEAMVIDWHETTAIVEAIKAADVVLIGPGLGTDETAVQLLKLAIAQQQRAQWLVIDGSAITLMAQLKLKLPYPQQTIFTPHQMEWQRLVQLPISQQNDANNLQAQQTLSAFVVLKSHRTVVYTLDTVYRNPIGTPAMATGGMGDTLAGMISGFLAQFSDKKAALLGAVYLHSYIGEALAQKHYVVLPTALSQEIPTFMKHFETLS
jgi:ADP-dependent NAD(P)H-hydrate dehydratase